MADIIVSIVIPVYNVDIYLENCLQTIKAQTYKNWECLLVDDGSIDNSGAICDQIAGEDKRFRVIHKKNGGVSSARNLGIKEAKGEWITFVDADDFVGETYLQGLLAPLLEGTQLDFVHGGCLNYENGKIITVNQEYEYYLGNDMGRLFRSFRGLVVSKLFYTSILRENGLLFDEGMKIAEDMAFTMDYIFFVNSYAFVPEKDYYYRRDNENSATHSTQWQQYWQSRKDFIHLYKSTVSFVGKNHIDAIDSHLRYKQRAQQYYQMLRTMYHDRSIKRKMRLDILQEDSRKGFFDLFRYLQDDNNNYETTKLLLENKIKRFDVIQTIKEYIENCKDYIKSLL